MVECIDRLKPELDSLSLSDSEPLREAKIQIKARRTGEPPVLKKANLPFGWIGKGRRVTDDRRAVPVDAEA